jgi:crotonobetainyl-CoA:carnitine CoA-transferase CaiB-like acyl-CoA transferase
MPAAHPRPDRAAGPLDRLTTREAQLRVSPWERGRHGDYTTQGGRSMTGLGGIRLIELAGGVGPAWVAKLFADLGADVICFEGGGAGERDQVRSRPFAVHRWLNTNKRSVTGGLEALLDGADALVHDLGPRVAAVAGLAPDTLAERYPALVSMAVTPFGSTGPYADYAAGELAVMHGSSWGFLSPSAATDLTLPPLKAPGHHATLTVGTVAAAVTLAAVERAAVTGVGEHIDYALFASGAKITETAPSAASFLGVDPSRVGAKTVAPWGIYACSDGLIQFICVEQAHWVALLGVMGDPDWGTWEVFASNEDRRQNADLIDLYLAEWFATQTVAEAYHKGQAARLCMSPVNTMAQLERDPQFAARGFWRRDPDGLVLPGPGFVLDQDWWGVRRAAPAMGRHDGETWAPRPAAAAARPAIGGTGEPAGCRPLEGVRVCDFSWIWAGPQCTLYLAHLGAEVIRIESPEHLCLMRRLPFAPIGMDLTPDTAGMFQQFNTDKRSIAVDLGKPEAAEIVRRLVACSDVVIDNFAAGTMAKLGFGVDDLRRINPEVVVASLTGYGQTGPSAGYMAYGPAGGAVAGLYAANGYERGTPAETGVAVGDPCTGITAAWAIVAALAARRRFGTPARVDVAMAEAVAATAGELWMQYQAEGVSPTPLANHDPLWSPHACYPAQGEDRWVTVACPTEQAWQALCGVVDPSLAQEPRFTTAARRKANEAALDRRIAAWTSTRDRWEVTEVLQRVGVAAFPSLSALELWGGDLQLEAIGMLERPEHPLTGRHVVPGVPWRCRNADNGLRRAAPLLGQHTAEVLGGLLGFTADDLAALAAAGVLPTL